MIEPTKYVEEACPCTEVAVCADAGGHVPACAAWVREDVERAMRRYAAAVLREAAGIYNEGIGPLSRTQISKGIRALAAQLEEDR